MRRPVKSGLTHYCYTICILYFRPDFLYLPFLQKNKRVASCNRIYAKLPHVVMIIAKLSPFFKGAVMRKRLSVMPA